MKIVQINSFNIGSTGNIMLGIDSMCKLKGYKSWCFTPAERINIRNKKYENNYFIGTIIERQLHLKLAYITGLRDCFSQFSTMILIRKIKSINPDVIHLHNLHNCYLNLSMLFRYIKKYNIRVVWTLHDCWAFTGQCPHFTIVKCDRWKTGCHHCPSYREYPKSYVDRTKTIWKLKKRWFTGVKNMTIVTPSQWLADLVKQSYLKDYSVKVINNGIDLDVFKPTPSNFRAKYNISDEKYILLGVAFDWSREKGLDVFVELARRLDERFQIVLVGTNENIDKHLPDNIYSIHHTQNKTELAEIYTAVDLFVNPTRQEVLGLVNIEANACGTPVLTFRTGGSPECIDDTCGSVIECDDICAMAREIIRICENQPYTQEACLKKAKEFDKNDRFEEYIKLYEVLNEKTDYLFYWQ